MPPKLYGSGWRRPDHCDCGKIPYRDEAAALAAAGQRGEESGVSLTVYKCPGSARWHKTGRGFHPRSLRTRPRIIAWHVSALGVISYAGLYQALGLSPDPDQDRAVKSKVRKVLHAFADLGLVVRDEPRPRYVTAVDRAGLLRVMQVGLEEYADSRDPDAAVLSGEASGN